jgi:signal transduction histidine kinase
MKFSSFIKEKIPSIIILLFFLFSAEIFLLLIDDRLFIHLYIGIGLIVCYTIGIAIEYWQKKKYYQEIKGSLEQLEDKYLLPEMMKDPSFIEGKLLKSTLQEVGKSMTEHVNSFKRNQEEYKEYIELWIHEIKTPIAVSKMIIENHRNEITNDIEEEIDKIDIFIEQALFYARSNHTEKDYLIKETKLKDIVGNVIVKNKKQLIEQKIKIELNLTEEIVYTDSKWIEFIINQIMMNSIKYKKEEEATITIKSNTNKENTELIIQDNGIGIKAAEIDRVFEKGFTGTNGRNIQKSTGIGLYLCQKLANRLGHQITIQSQEGKGTTITLIFPQSSFYQL